MSEREKEIINKLGKALPFMSDFDKGYILCMAEMSEAKSTEKEEKEEKEAELVGCR